MDAASRVARILAKIERARTHLRELESRIEAFLRTSPYTIGASRDNGTRQWSYRVQEVLDPPVAVGPIIGHVIHNLRSALDHLVYQLFLAAGNTQCGRDLSFPILKDRESYRKGAPGRLHGIRPEAIAAIDALNPDPAIVS